MHNNNVLLRNGLLIDGTGKKEVENVHISIQNGKFSSIFHDDYKVDNSKYDRVIELDGLTILPGFINSHVHSGFKLLKGEPCRNFQEEYLRACINEGVTTIRDEGMLTDDTIEDVIEKKRLLEDSIYYPRIITTGKFFSAPGGYGGMQPISVEAEEEARIKVNEVLNKGINMIKTVLEDGLDPSTFGLPKLSDELLKAICDEAHKRGAKVSAHVTQAHNLKRLVDAGIDDAGHIVYDDLTDELIFQMIEKGIYVVPTLTVLKMINDKFGAPVLEKGKENVYRFVKMGGKIGLGDDFLEEDMPWYRLGMPKMELQLLKEAGLTSMEIIVASTKHGAEICAIDKEVGTVEVGKIADLLIVEGNPLEDIGYISNVKKVIKDGFVVLEN
ncbi:amidohydrolase family protein [Mobilitalea sibirica]|uniref:Amidohydrolase family protein n=1 Tax=Mobilitalea sibirica TaxID=1462919 RepID=A0A8J7KY40_9FIRM|nr:amidohydrolase family protein [Mobilitalea sibirica]MBH1942582.1 amidohydrolase family protein [Mobilitalea sibirica]